MSLAFILMRIQFDWKKCVLYLRTKFLLLLCSSIKIESCLRVALSLYLKQATGIFFFKTEFLFPIKMLKETLLVVKYNSVLITGHKRILIVMRDKLNFGFIGSIVSFEI